jgi:hypothetical protein
MLFSCSLPLVISCLFLVHFILITHASFLCTFFCHLMPLSCSLPPVISCLFLFTSSCHLMPLFVHFHLSSYASLVVTFSCHLMPLFVYFHLSSYASSVVTSSCHLMHLSCSLLPVIKCFFIAHKPFFEFLILCHLLTLF